MSRMVLLLLVLSVCPGCAFLRRVFPPPPPAGVSQDAFKMPGVYGRAAGVALGDFLEHQARENEALSLEDREKLAPGARALNECFARPEAYDVYVYFEEQTEMYKVTILPVPEVCLGKEAYALMGGGAKYELDARSFTILKQELME